MSMTVFFLCFAAGIVCGTVEKAVSPLRRKLGLVFTIPTDIVIAFAAVALHMLVMYFYTDGQFFVYAALGEILGFIIARAVIRYLFEFIKSHTKNRETV